MKSVSMRRIQNGEQTLVETFGTQTDYLNIPIGLNDIDAISAGSDQTPLYHGGIHRSESNN
jgi:hypothetical protein